MITIKGTCNEALVYTDNLDTATTGQLEAVCNASYLAECKIRVMPDVHAGKGCTIGTTMTIHDKVVPNMVGVDIGCGMETVKLKDKRIDFTKLDSVIRKYIPCGSAIREAGREHSFASQIDLTQLRFGKQGYDRAYRSIGTLGGGNHFIEVDKDEEGNLYLVIHSGSRHLGVEVAEYYQEAGYEHLAGADKASLQQLIDELKAENREQEIASAIKERKAAIRDQVIPQAMAYVSGKLFDDYIHDMKITQEFAMLNRKAMAQTIIKQMKLKTVDEFTTVHNYIDTEAMILRKGAVAARKGQQILIPINMRDGSLICMGKGNDDWNQSAPHGAGRLMSRKEARNFIPVKAYKESMQGIFTTCVSKNTVDEAPMAYKSMDDILKHIEPTAEVVKIIKPVFNFKAEE